MTKRNDQTKEARIGAKLRQARMMKGHSQEWLGEQVGVTFQQIQKYEKGTNRISVSRLLQFACVLEMPVSFFVEEKAGKESQPAIAAMEEFMATVDGLSIVQNWAGLSKSARRIIVMLVENISKSGAEADLGKISIR